MISLLIVSTLLFTILSIVIAQRELRLNSQKMYLPILEDKDKELQEVHSQMAKAVNMLEKSHKLLWRKQDLKLKEEINQFLDQLNRED